eukprot:349678-Chlamydomonas_euryale.AAC.1
MMCCFSCDLEPRGLPAGRSVLELGCGLGIVGVACARAGAAALALTDGDVAVGVACGRSVMVSGSGQTGAWINVDRMMCMLCGHRRQAAGRESACCLDERHCGPHRNVGASTP